MNRNYDIKAFDQHQLQVRATSTITSILSLQLICILLTRSDLLSGTRLAVTLRGDEPDEKLEILKDLDLIMLLHYLPEGDEKSSRVHSSRR